MKLVVECGQNMQIKYAQMATFSIQTKKSMTHHKSYKRTCYMLIGLNSLAHRWLCRESMASL